MGVGVRAHGRGSRLHLEMPARPLWAWSPCGQKAPLLVKLCLPKRDAGGRAGTYSFCFGFRFLQFGAGAAESGDDPGSEADILTPDFAGLYLRARSAPSPRDLAGYRENIPFTGGRQAQRGQVTFLGFLSRGEMEPKHPSDRTYTHTHRASLEAGPELRLLQISTSVGQVRPQGPQAPCAWSPSYEAGCRGLWSQRVLLRDLRAVW